MRAYCTALLRNAANFLTDAWESCLLAPLDLCGMMACVRLPARLQPAHGSDGGAQARALQVRTLPP